MQLRHNRFAVIQGHMLALNTMRCTFNSHSLARDVLAWRAGWRVLQRKHACRCCVLTGGGAGLVVRGMVGAGAATGAGRTVRGTVVLAGGGATGCTGGLAAGLLMGMAGLLAGTLVAGRLVGVAAGGAALLAVAALAAPEISSSFCSSSAWYCLRSSICDGGKELRLVRPPAVATQTRYDDVDSLYDHISLQREEQEACSARGW